MSFCKIQLDNIGCFSPGDEVCGKMICVIAASENVREIACTLEGKEQTKFYKKRGRLLHWVYGNHELFKMKITFHEEGIVEAGNYEYPFSFTLPSIIPGSFEDTYGKITYLITGIVSRSFTPYYLNEVNVHIVAPINLDLIKQQLCLEPIVYHEETVLCCWCCSSAPISMNVYLEKNAFILGETAKINVEINNLSNKDILKLDVKLIRNMEYRCDSRDVFKKETIVASTSTNGVRPQVRRLYLINFQIPETIVVDNLALCTLIKNFWSLTIEAVIAGNHNNLIIPIKIFLGHNGLESYIPNCSNSYYLESTLDVNEELDMSK